MRTVDRSRFTDWYKRVMLSGGIEAEEDRDCHSAFVGLSFGHHVALTVDGVFDGYMLMRTDDSIVRVSPEDVSKLNWGALSVKRHGNIFDRLLEECRIRK